MKEIYNFIFREKPYKSLKKLSQNVNLGPKEIVRRALSLYDHIFNKRRGQLPVKAIIIYRGKEELDASKPIDDLEGEVLHI